MRWAVKTPATDPITVPTAVDMKMKISSISISLSPVRQHLQAGLGAFDYFWEMAALNTSPERLTGSEYRELERKAARLRAARQNSTAGSGTRRTKGTIET
jgi:hypothetical protein